MRKFHNNIAGVILTIPKLKRLAAIVFSLIIWQNHAAAQYTAEYSKVILPSPNAASLGTFGNNSKGTYNGVPDISIPLFQNIFPNQAGNIFLSYDASGTKTYQDATWVGLGWRLAYGGGVITRTVRGMDDLLSGGYHCTDTLPSQSTLDKFYSSQGASDPMGTLTSYLFSVENGLVDTEPDIFSFNIGNYNGKFVFDKIVKGSSIVQLQGSNLKIIYVNPGWQIIDGDGNKYYFNKQESALDWSTTKDYEVFYHPTTTEFENNSTVHQDIVTAWYLDSIVTAKSQKIAFSYTTEQSVSIMHKSEQEYTLISAPIGCPPTPSPYHTYTASQQMLSNMLPNTITFPNGSIEFHRAPRSDIHDVDGNNSSSCLDYIVQKDNNGSVLKKIQFYYSYFNPSDPDPTNKRLKLDSVKDVSDALHPVPPYKMSYFNPAALPPKITKAIDHWGYYNGQTGNQTLLVATTETLLYYKQFAGANRRPDTTLASVQNGVLSSLGYPTGGRTDFTFELNQYTDLFGYDQWDPRDTTVALGPSPPNAANTSATFTLTEATEVTFNFNYFDPNNPDSKDEFISDYAFLDMNGQSYITFHNSQYVDNGGNNQLTYVYTQTVLLAAGTYTMRLNPLFPAVFYAAFSAQWTKHIYLTQRKGGGLRIKRIENYDNTGQKTVDRFQYNNGSLSSGLILEPPSYDYPAYIVGTSECGGGPEPFSSLYYVRCSNTTYLEGFTEGGIIGYTKVAKLSGENGENGQTEYDFFTYGPQYIQTPYLPIPNNPLDGKLVAVKQFDAGNVLKKKTEYATAGGGPYDSPSSIPGIKLLSFPGTTTAFYTTIYGNNTSFIPTTQETETDYLGLDSIKTVKNYYYNNIVHKQMSKMVETTSKGDVLTTNFTYPDDLKSTGIPNVYNAMSNNNFQNPVVEQDLYKNNVFLEAKRIDYGFWKNGAWGDNTANLFLPQFAETKLGTNPFETRISYNAYDNSGNLLEQSQPGGLHVAYLWGYGNQYPIVEVKNATYQNVLSTLGQTLVGQLASITPGNDISVRTALNQLRTFLPNSQATTYTYTPLIGITSATDAKGQTIYYEYDSFNRLANIKDKDGNIIKHYDYHYQGQ